VNARREATERLDHRYDARVLEPSPPAVISEPVLADDPLAPDEHPTGRPLVLPLSPRTTDALTWLELAAADADLAAWCAPRWLGPWPQLPAPPATLATTRDSLHAVAERILAPARHRASGKIGLRYTRGGFGTPFFRVPRGVDTQLRVSDGVLVRQVGEDETPHSLTTLRDAAAVAGVAPDATTGVYDPTTSIRPGDALNVDPEAARFFGEWFGFAASVLEQLRAEATPPDQPSRLQLWPEHFDLAIELGPEQSRGTFGCSPGDAAHAEPYLYASHWHDVAPDQFWNDAGGSYASLPLSTFQSAPDHREAALEFFREGRGRLRS
jgi:hypothetical protein